MSVLGILRGYTLREYGVILMMALLGGIGVVFVLNSMGGGASAGEELLKREPVVRKETASLRFVEANATAKAEARAEAARRAKVRAARRLAAERAVRRARAAAARSAPARRTVVRTVPRKVAPAPTRVVNNVQSRPAPAPKPAPAPAPKPQKSSGGGGGGGSFDDSG
jgi:hypothetical protein